WKDHLVNRRLLSMFVIGFILLFVFVAVFTYAGFRLTSDTFGFEGDRLGLVYLVFAPAILTTPAAAKAARSLGSGLAFRLGILAALLGLALLLTPSLLAFLLGLTLVAAGAFFAQSVATASVGRTVTHDQAAANGLYLACYYAGGISGAFVVGQIFTLAGWHVAIGVMMALTLTAAVFGRAITES
ncbi:MAG: MFS transporter, partial [Pseudomonadota bacterium]